LRYKEDKKKQKWKLHPELMTSSTVTLSTLRSDTQYIFQVRMVNDEIEGPYSETSDPVQTIQSAAQQLLNFTYDVSRPDVEMPLKKIPLQENKGTRNELAKTRKLVIGKYLPLNTNNSQTRIDDIGFLYCKKVNQFLLIYWL
jgi:hypothetical protein